MASCVQRFGLPTGPGRQEVVLRRPTAPGASHDCFTGTELILHATASPSLSKEDEAHLLGGLGSGCTACWSAITEAKEALLEDVDFVETERAEIEFLRALTVYRPEALPTSFRLAVERAKNGGVEGIVSVLVESICAFWWKSPRRMLEELEHARELMGEEDGWKAISSRIDTWCGRAWMRVEDLSAEEAKHRAIVALQAAMHFATVSGDQELLAVATAAWSEVEPSRTESALWGAIQLLPDGNPLRPELLNELSASFAQNDRHQDAFSTALTALGEVDCLQGNFPILELSTLHRFSTSAVAMVHEAQDQPPYFGLYLSMASVGHTLCRNLIDWADEAVEVEIMSLELDLLGVSRGYRSAEKLIEQWLHQSESTDPGLRAVELLWIATCFGFTEFVDAQLQTVHAPDHSVCRRVQALCSLGRGSQIVTLVLFPFLEFLQSLENEVNP